MILNIKNALQRHLKQSSKSILILQQFHLRLKRSSLIKIFYRLHCRSCYEKLLFSSFLLCFKWNCCNSLTDSLNTVSSEFREIQAGLPDELINILKRNGFTCVDSEVRNGSKLIYIETEIDYKFDAFLVLDYKMKSDYSVIPVFSFKRINENRRKRFIEEQISFTTEKEIHLYTEI